MVCLETTTEIFLETYEIVQIKNFQSFVKMKRNYPTWIFCENQNDFDRSSIIYRFPVIPCAKFQPKKRRRNSISHCWAMEIRARYKTGKQIVSIDDGNFNETNSVGSTLFFLFFFLSTTWATRFRKRLAKPWRRPAALLTFWRAIRSPWIESITNWKSMSWFHAAISRKSISIELGMEWQPLIIRQTASRIALRIRWITEITEK